jgi:hypothetical protein
MLIASFLVFAAVAAITIDPAGWRDAPPPPEPPRSDVSTSYVARSPSTAANRRTCISAERRARAKVKRVSGRVSTFRVNKVPDGQTFDLRGANVVGYPKVNRYPLMVGKYGPAPGSTTSRMGSPPPAWTRAGSRSPAST